MSSDGGTSWSDLRDDNVLIEPICQASMLQHDEMIYFLNPASKDRRENMTLRRSEDQGKSWSAKIVIHPGPSAYSDMVFINNRKIGVYFEGGKKSPYEGIAFEIVKLKDF